MAVLCTQDTHLIPKLWLLIA